MYEPLKDVFNNDLAGTLASNLEHNYAIDLKLGGILPHLLIYNLLANELIIL